MATVSSGQFEPGTVVYFQWQFITVFCQLKPQGWNFQQILLVPLAFLKVSLSFNLLSRKLNYKPLFTDKIKLKFKLICHDFHQIRLLSTHPSHVVLKRPHFHGKFSASFFSPLEVARFDKIPGSFCKMMKNKWYHAKLLLKRFQFNSNTIGFHTHFIHNFYYQQYYCFVFVFLIFFPMAHLNIFIQIFAPYKFLKSIN